MNIKITNSKEIAFEGNARFRIENNNSDFGYYDTAQIVFPDQTPEFTNRIYLQFEDSNEKDSVFLVVSKYENTNLYWNQIFYSSVSIDKLNEFSTDISEFRINDNLLIELPLLENNDTLIFKVLNYMETHKNKLFSPNCGTICETFKEISAKFNLPCRTVTLQGGDAIQEGLDDAVGYPLHAVCEIFSSKLGKWYVIDPLYGLRFRNIGTNDYLNAVEINNMVFFKRERFIVQDSVLTTMRSMVGRDYFKFYENIYYPTEIDYSMPIKKFLEKFYSKFVYNSYHYTYVLKPVKNGFYYVIFKSIVFWFLTIVYFNAILLIITRRLFTIKIPKQNIK